MMSGQTDFISPYEAEHLIKDLKDIDLREYGSKQWFGQHETLDRLNIQAHQNAISSSDEFVMESFVSHDKINLLVADLLAAEVWKEKIFPRVKHQIAKLSGIKSYICLYHEASVANLLEVLLYHRTACENSEDALVELIDYCYRKFVQLNSKAESYIQKQQETPKPIDPKAYLELSAEKELENQANEIEFSSTMISFSIIRFITDHLQDLSVPIVHQLMENNDLPCVLVPILETKPWLRKNVKGEIERFEDQKWDVVRPENAQKLPKIEAQIWLSIYNMFLSQDTNRKYEVTSYRKGNLLRLRKYLNEQLLDQLPMLSHLLRALEELSMTGDNPIAHKNSFIVQQMPEIRVKILRNRNFDEIAKYQLENFFNAEANDPQEELKSLFKLYGSDVYEQFMGDPKCAECGEVATQRCSKCKQEWYCSRECQLKKWKQHKNMCALLTKAREEDQEKEEQIKTVIQERAKEPKRPMIQELN